MQFLNEICKKIKRNSITHIWLAYVFLASGLVVNFIQLLTVPLWYLGLRNLYRKLILNLNYLSWSLIPGVAQWWAGVDVYMYARPHDFKMLGNERVLAILNHKAQLDWVISWVVADFCNILGNAKCIVKDALRYVPVLGWGFWFSEYIFLKRNMEKDRSILNNGLKNLSSFVQNFWLLIFCEGTRFTPEKHKQSNEFAIKNGMKPLKHHLMPRTKGFVFVTQGLRTNVDTLYDATVCFRGEAVNYTFTNMLEGKPCVGDFFVRRVPISEVPTDEKECVQYVYDMYYEKDELCEYHQKHDIFPIGDESIKYKDFIQKKVPKNYLTLYIILFWAIVTTVPLAYYTFYVLSSGSWAETSIFTGLVVTVTFVFYMMLEATKPKSSYGK